MHFEHQTIENTALPATWLRQDTVLIFSKISPIFEIWLCLCVDCKVNCQTQPITVELTTVSNLNAAISCTDDLAHNFFFNTRPAA